MCFTFVLFLILVSLLPKGTPDKFEISDSFSWPCICLDLKDAAEFDENIIPVNFFLLPSVEGVTAEFFVPLDFDFKDTIAENYTISSASQYGIQHCTPACKKETVSSEKTLASPQDRTENSQSTTAAAGVPDVGYPPFQGYQLPTQNQSCDVSTVEMSTMQAAPKTFGSRVPYVQSAVANCNRQKLCAQRAPTKSGHVPTAYRACAAICFAMATATSNDRLVSWMDSSRWTERQVTQIHAKIKFETWEAQPMIPVGMPPTPASIAAAPLAPLPPPAVAPSSTSVPQSSMPGMPAMPAMPSMPTPASTSGTTMTPEEVQELLQTLKSRQSELPSDIQQQVQKVATKTRARLTKEHHSAVTLHSKAKEELENAILARTQLLSNWRVFIGDAVRLWQNYATNFMEQEKNLQTRIAAAKEGVLAAKEELARANRENDIKVQEISDEEIDMDTSAGATKRVTDNMQGLATSLMNLEKEAAALVDSEHAAKRQRKDSPKQEDFGEDSPFGAAG
eukprot:s157_g6.t1